MKRLFIIANILLLFLGIYSAVGLFNKMAVDKFSDVKIEKRPHKAPSKVQRQDQYQPVSYYSTVVDKNMFGTKVIQEVVVAPEVTAQKQKEQREEAERILNNAISSISLIGTIKGDEKTSRAIIRNLKTRKSDLYKIGDEVERVFIKEVYREKIILGYSDIKVAVYMLGANQKQLSRLSLSERNKPEIRTPAQHISLEKKTVENAIKNVNQLGKQIRVRPYYRNGMAAGFQIRFIKEKSIFDGIGLKKGDIIKGVSGLEINDVNDAMKAFNKYQSSNEVDLQISRNGRIETINYKIK